ncbi:MAG: hypothetical protein OXN89_13105 [Bryobacterales bacterium]|nr:hypothetical protein [Bryobacterales bacterium]
MAASRFPNCSPRRTGLALALLAVAFRAGASEAPGNPWLDRMEPFGGQAGQAVEVLLAGANLELPAELEFDSPHLTGEAGRTAPDGGLIATVRIAVDAPPGPHIATLRTPRGRSNSRLFYVHEMPPAREVEPNDTLGQAQQIDLRTQTLHGAMHTIEDVDTFRFEAEAGERWIFDLRSLEYGGFLENNLALLDSRGEQVAFSDDRDDYLETPFLEHVFEQTGPHYLKLDQYRGPQRVNCNKNCGYMLRIGQTPVVEAASPLGARAGSEVSVSLLGRGLADVGEVWMQPVRRAEYYRLTFPFTIPLRTDTMGGESVQAHVSDRRDDRLKAEFRLPADAPRGLWRIWVRSPGGIADGLSFVVSDLEEPDCARFRPAAVGTACNGVLAGGRSGQDEYWLRLEAGEPLVVTTLAAQLGLPRIDTVLELFDAEGNLVASHDDLMSGQGTVIGNPDSFLHARPARSGEYRLVVRDRIGRTGPDMAYRLHVERREPRFALLSDPENLNVVQGGGLSVGVLLIPEPGFSGAVDVWLEDAPEGIAATRATFAADQYFGPSGDGDNVVIPTAFIDVLADARVAAGDYPLRIAGQTRGGEATAEAISTLWIGPPTKRNDVRRPLESVRLTVLNSSAASPAADAHLSASGGAR